MKLLIFIVSIISLLALLTLSVIDLIMVHRSNKAIDNYVKELYERNKQDSGDKKGE